MKIAICDDEAVQRELLAQYVREWAKEREAQAMVRLFPNSESFLFEWEENKEFDLLILDIEMGTMNGMELARRIRMADEELPILFVTGYDRYMAQGYEVAAFHYLLKPIEREKFFAAMDRFYHRKSGEKPEEKMLFRTEEGIAAIPLSKLWYIEADRHKCVLSTKDRKYTLRQSMSSIEKELPREIFVRPHRSFLVNILHVAAVARGEIILDNGMKLPLSRNMNRSVNAKFIEYFGNHADET